MTDVGGAAALLVAAVMAAAAVAKLRTPAPTAAAFTALGLPRAGALARAAPVVELALAAGLVAVPAGAALVSVALLAAFTTVLARAVASGRDVPCGCFGAAGHASVSRVDLVRNGLLMAAALVAALAAPATAEWPALPGLVAVGSLAAAGAVALALGRHAQRTGRLWSTGVDQ